LPSGVSVFPANRQANGENQMHSPNKPNGHRAQVVDLNTRLCPVCHEPFRRNLTGRAKRFCSDACRDSARRDKKAVQRFKNDARYPYGGEPRNDAKSACGPRGNFQKMAVDPLTFTVRDGSSISRSAAGISGTKSSRSMASDPLSLKSDRLR
jgi:hypothetical protein